MSWTPTLTGIAHFYNVLSTPGGNGWRYCLLPGALKIAQNLALYYNHLDRWELATSSNLRVVDAADCLRFEAVPKIGPLFDRFARDIARGRFGASIGFREYIFDDDPGHKIRLVYQATLAEISLTRTPAQRETLGTIRADFLKLAAGANDLADKKQFLNFARRYEGWT